MNRDPPLQQRTPGLRHASVLSLALWSVGYLIYVFVTSTMDGVLPDAPLWLTYFVQFAVAIAL